MRVAVALLLVLAALAILALQASHCVADQTGNQTGYQTSNNASLNHMTAVNDVDYSGTGSITGVILASPDSHAVPNANVGLYDENDNLVDIPENPQLSSNGTGNNGGVYMFYGVPYGYYTVKAEKGGVEFFAVVNLSSGTATANVVLPEYVETEPAYQEPLPPEVPTPTPKPFRYFLPITVGKMPAAAQPNEGLPIGLATIGGIGALILFTRRNGKA